MCKCEVCIEAKMCKKPFSIFDSMSNWYFDLIHSDVWGSAHIEGMHHEKYFMTFVDDKSRDI